MRFYLFFCLFLLFSCGSGDQKICECLEAGDKLNQVSAQLLEGKSSASSEEMQRLKEDKLKKCREFEQMSGEEMLRRKADCDLDEATEEQNDEMIEIMEQSKGK